MLCYERVIELKEMLHLNATSKPPKTMTQREHIQPAVS